MYRMLCLTVAAMSVAFASLPTSALAQFAVKQIELTENRIEGFIAAQNDILAVVEKIDAVSSDHANTNYEAELDAVTRKHGFQGLAEYDAVAVNISLIMAGIDPETKVFTDPQTAIKKEIEELNADEAVPQSEKKNLLEELNAVLKAAEPIQFPMNIELVKKYYDKLEVTTISISDDDSRPSSAVRTIRV
jgi:hypothetical protein